MLKTIKVDLGNKHCKLIAHRGLSGLAPENTMPSFKLAVEHGYYGIECDIHVIKDGSFVVFHDSELDRMTNKKGLVKQLTKEEIKQATIINGKNASKYPDNKIPLLEELYELCVNTGIVPIVEIKTVRNEEDLDRLVDLTKQYNLYDKVVFIAFNLDYLLYLRQNYNDLNLQFIINEIKEDIINLCVANKLDIDVNKSNLTVKQIERCHENNLLVNSWTIDDPILAQHLIYNNIDFITTNILTDNKNKKI